MCNSYLGNQIAHMDIILWRHADAHPACKSDQLDLTRPLTSKGRKQASAMARWLIGT